MDITVTYKTFWWKSVVFFTVVFYKDETRWRRLTLTGQVAFKTYLYNMISFLALRLAKTLGCFWTNSNTLTNTFGSFAGGACGSLQNNAQAYSLVG